MVAVAAPTDNPTTFRLQRDLVGQEPEEPKDQMATSRVEFIRKSLSDRGFSEEVIELVLSSSTHERVHDSRWDVFGAWCLENDLDPFDMNETTLANFLAEKGKSVSPPTVNNYRASILNVWKVCSEAVVASQSEVIKMMLKSMTLKTPIKAKYQDTWDLDLLMRYVAKLAESDKPLDVRDTLILLLRIMNLRRCGDCHNILFDKVNEEDGTFVQLRRKRDHNITEKETAPIQYQACSECPSVCLKRAFRRYFEMFRPLKSADARRLFLATNGKEIAAATIRSRSHFHMKQAGIPERFKAHSIRMASASKMLDKGVPIEEVMKVGDWTSIHVFLVFYHRSRVQTNIPRALVVERAERTEEIPRGEARASPRGRTRGSPNRHVGGGF